MTVRDSRLWTAAFLVWLGVLWWLSSAPREFPEPLHFTASDKLLHFGYFFGGAGLLSAAIHLRFPGMKASRRIATTVVLITLVGVVDEIHQSFVPGRQGNDPFDLMADVLGAVCGSLVFHRYRWCVSRP